jgi:hypothetical protein
MTRIDPKISVVDPVSSRNDEQYHGDTTFAGSTKFIKIEDQDPWKALTTGSDIGDMVNAMNGVEETARKNPIDALLDSLIIVDPVANYRFGSDHSMPKIPDLHEDLFKDNPKLKNNMEPIVERYEALQLTLQELRDNTLESLKYPMTPSEIQSNQKYIEDLNEALMKVEAELEEANYYWHLQKVREQAAREAEATEDA